MNDQWTNPPPDFTYLYFERIDSVLNEKRTYYLFSGRREYTLKNAQYRKFAGLTDELLQAAGFTKVDGPDTANVIIAFIYGFSKAVIITKTGEPRPEFFDTI